MKPKIHFHTDCPFFAGCENMLSVLFNNEKFNETFYFSFSYNYSIEYSDGLKQRVERLANDYPLFLSKPSSAQTNPIKKLLVKILQPFLFLADTYTIYKVVKKEKPDIIHINNGGYPGALSCSAAVLSAKLAGKKNIFYVVNNIAVPINSIQRAMLYPIDFLVGRYVTKFVTASGRAKEAIKKVLGVTEDKVLQLPNTIVPRKISTENNKFRAEYGIGINDIVIGCVALFVKRKGHIYLIEAFSEFIKKYNGKNKVRLILDGSGIEKESIEQLIKEKNLENVVIITNRKNIYDLYNAMDFLVLPSKEMEDFPNVVIESMYMQKPVIGTDVGGISEQIKNGISGIIVKPMSSEELEGAISKLVNDEKLRHTMGENAKKRFDNEFSESAIVNRYIEQYNALLLNSRKVH